MSHQINKLGLLGNVSGALLSAAVLFPAGVQAQPVSTAAEQGRDGSVGGAVTLTDIIVTAQKREEAVNSVPQSITAVTADQMRLAGVTDAPSLVKLTPGLTYADSANGTPIYTIRGIGFSDQSIGGRPTVTVYQDEVPIPFAIETRAAFLDLDHVEVLKGPQGTLFGSNSTGGAINVITAKPTKTLTGGVDVSYGRFNAMDASGHISGPLSDTVSARLAVQHIGRSAWQQSFTNSAKTGEGDFSAARLILDWTPSDRFTVEFTANGWVDKSDTQAAQLLAITLQNGPTSEIGDLINYPAAPRNNRAADFDLGRNYGRDNYFAQFTARADYQINDDLLFTSISSYSHYKQDELVDADGTTYANVPVNTEAEIDSFFQEVRLSGAWADRGVFTIGANYAYDEPDELTLITSTQSTLAATFTPLGAPLLTSFNTIAAQKQETKAVFASADFNVTDTIKLNGGIRYTDTSIKYHGGVADTGDGNAAAVFSILTNLIRGGVGLPPVTIPPGGFIVLDPTLTPREVRNRLDEDNISWRAGVTFTPQEGAMLYANASRGYKAGSFPQLQDTASAAYNPATQESVLAYEAGFKLSLADRTVQLNGAAFYYDYEDKQIRGLVVDPIFGVLTRLVNIPKSRVTGAELQLSWIPIRGLTINAGGTYVKSKVRGDFDAPDAFGDIVNYRGAAFPNAPKWQFSLAADYTWPLSDSIDALVGGNVYHQSRASSFLGDLPLNAIDAYTLVDLRAGVQSRNGDWRFLVWGRNVGDTYYWTFANKISDTSIRYTGMSATYGVSLSYRFR